MTVRCVSVEIGLGPKANGVERKDGFNITVASEIMAVLCLATVFGRSQGASCEACLSHTTTKGEPVYRCVICTSKGRWRHDHEGRHQAEPDPDAGA